MTGQSTRALQHAHRYRQYQTPHGSKTYFGATQLPVILAETFQEFQLSSKIEIDMTLVYDKSIHENILTGHGA
jgi:hypothetical protein